MWTSWLDCVNVANIIDWMANMVDSDQTAPKDVIWMCTHNMCLYKEVDKKYAGCNLKTTELLDSVLLGVCAVIRSNRVFCGYLFELHWQDASDEYPQCNILLWKSKKNIWIPHLIWSYYSLLFCLCWGFTAGHIQQGHVERIAFT